MGTWGWSLCSPFWGPTPHCDLFSTLAAVSFFLTTWDGDISAIQELPHELHPPWGCSLFDWTNGDRGLGTTIPITLSYIQVLYPQS